MEGNTHDKTPLLREEDLSKTEKETLKLLAKELPQEPDGEANNQRPSIKKAAELLTRSRGIILAGFAACGFAVMSLLTSVLVKVLSQFQIVFIQSSVMLLGSVLIVCITRIAPPTELKAYMWLCLSGAAISTYIVTFAASMMYVPVGDAVAVTYTSVMWALGLGWLFLEEPLRLLDCLLAVGTIVGVFLISSPSVIFEIASMDVGPQMYDSLIGASLAMAASISLGLNVVCVRKQSLLGVHSLFSQLFNLSVAFAVSATVFLIFGEWSRPSVGEWVCAIFIGLSFLIANACSFFALACEEAHRVVLILTLEIVIVYVLQIFLLHIQPDWTSVAGGLLIFSACILTSAFRATADD